MKFKLHKITRVTKMKPAPEVDSVEMYRLFDRESGCWLTTCRPVSGYGSVYTSLKDLRASIRAGGTGVFFLSYSASASARKMIDTCFSSGNIAECERLAAAYNQMIQKFHEFQAKTVVYFTSKGFLCKRSLRAKQECLPSKDVSAFFALVDYLNKKLAGLKRSDFS